ncbi:MAG: DUF624 domain-containing protein [Acholeplasmataceae bacterium]|nr:DUF624 domain-containing protein [Acholeplasmataceae bacterium]
MFEKPFFHKLNLIADWILRIVILNIFLVFSTLLVVTLYPGISASYKLFKEWKQGENTPIFGGFWKYFKEDFKRKISISIILILIVAIGVYSLITYNEFIKENSGTIYLVGYFVVLIFLIGFVLVTLFTIPVMLYFKEINLTNIYKISLYVMAKYFYITLLVSVLWVIPAILLYFPKLMVIYVIAGLSLTVLLWVLVSAPIFRFLERISKNV